MLVVRIVVLSKFIEGSDLGDNVGNGLLTLLGFMTVREGGETVVSGVGCAAETLD